MEINIGLIGLGTVGSGVVDILNRSGNLIEKRTGIRINLKKVCDLRIEKMGELKLKQNIFTNNFKDIINCPNIDVVVELIGGYDPAKDIISRSLRSGKHVVTANKAVISKYFKELFAESGDNKAILNFGASVAGSIPILDVIRDRFATENISSVFAILNGTTNFILTKIEEGLSYGEALKIAQNKGFAERDPTFDVEGKDSAMKLSILSNLICNAPIDAGIYTEGIGDITYEDISHASDIGYRIKLIAILKKDKDVIELRVHPTLIPKHNELASVANEFNAILLKGDNIGTSLLYGLGAGKLPTANAVISDIIKIGNHIRDKTYSPQVRFFNKLSVKSIDDVESRYFIKFLVVDKIGVLARISAILSEYGISISGVWVKGKNDGLISLITTTHKASNRSIFEAVKKIDSSENLVEGKSKILRIEDIDDL